MAFADPAPARLWSGAAPGREPDGTLQVWQRSARPSRTAGLGRGLRVLLGLGVLSGLWAAIIWVGLWYEPPRPIAVVVVGAGYETNLTVPHNVYGMRTAIHLAADTTLPRIPVGPPLRLTVGQAWDRDLDAADSDVVLVYLALHGNADEGGAYLLRDNADARRAENNLLRLTDVLARFRKLPTEKTKVLVVDATQPGADWVRGSLRNEFARGLAELNGEIVAVPNLVVISSSSPDERSWESPEFGETVFGAAFRAALAGSCDDPDGDSMIRLDEAFVAVRDEVSRWARVNRGSSQRPVLFPGGAEGVRRASRVILGRRNPVPRPRPPAPQPLPPELEAAWQSASQLASLTPGPEAYTPSLWRRYLDATLRYEELLLAGDTENAGKMRSTAREYESGLRAGTVVSLESLGNAIPMPAAAGVATTPSPDTRRLAASLWNASPADLGRRLSAGLATTAADPVADTAVRLQITGLSLELAGSDADFRSRRWPGVMAALETSGRPRPAEAHFLTMLQRDLPDPPPPDDLIRAAVQTRLLAERAALGTTGTVAYPERVRPFTRRLIEQGDTARLAGQDLLFANSPDAWNAARTSFAAADRAYQSALERASAVASAFAVRDRAFVELPYHGRWLAGRLDADDLVTTAETLWADVHAIDRTLRDASVTDDPHFDFDDLGRRANDGRSRLDRLSNAAAAAARRLAVLTLPDATSDATAVLQIPLLPADVRAALLANVRQASWRLYVESDGATPETLSDKQVASQSDSQARRQGRMALATIGEGWFGRLTGPQAEAFALTRTRVETFPATPSGWRTLLTAASDIAARFNSGPTSIRGFLQLAAGQTGDSPLGPLSDADGLARILPSSETALVPADPAGPCRLAWLARLLTRQAERTWEEHWSAERPANEPYFRRTGRLFTADATGSGDPAAIRAIAAKLDNPGTLEVTFPPPTVNGMARSLTTESNVTILATVRPADGSVVPMGSAVRRSVPGTGLRQPTDANGVVLTPIRADPTSFTIALTNDRLGPSETNPPARPTPIMSGLTESVLFRGQWVRADLPIAIYPRPFVTVNTFPTPTLASVAIRASEDVQDRFGRATGTVVFVLDCSGSMGVPAGEPFGPTAKFAEATKVLSDVLADLPAGTRFSVWAFGQKSDATLTAADAERTIAQVVPATVRLDGDAKQLADVMAKVRYPALEPWNESPILRAMLQAKADFRDESGYKTMVVVTDGMDNRYKADKLLNPTGESIPALLRKEFDGSGVTTHVIGFKLPEPEEDEVRKQFSAVAALDPPGTFTDTDDAVELGRAIRRALRQSVRYWVETPTTVVAPGVPIAGLEVGEPDGGDRWFRSGLKPGAWKVRVLDRPFLVDDVYLAATDRLLLDLVPRGNGLALRRAAWAATDFPARPWTAARDWRLSLIQNRQDSAGYRGLAVLERAFDPGETVLQVPRPRQVWLDLKPTDPNAEPIAVEWHATQGYPAAAWTLTSPTWDTSAGGPARPVVTAWWNPDQEPTVAGRVDRGIDFKTIADLSGKSLSVDDSPVVIRDVVVEDHVVETAPGRREKTSCLAVRLEHAVGHGVAVRVPGPTFSGQSLWQYPPAGRTTALFWPANTTTAGAVAAVELISVTAMRERAELRGYNAVLKELPAPDPADDRPQPPLPLP